MEALNLEEIGMLPYYMHRYPYPSIDLKIVDGYVLTHSSSSYIILILKDIVSFNRWQINSVAYLLVKTTLIYASHNT